MPYVSCTHCAARVYASSDPAKRGDCPVCAHPLPKPRLIDIKPLMPASDAFGPATESLEPTGS